MTIHVTLAVRDTQLAAYGRPFYAPTIGSGIRAFEDEANHKDSMINRHPEDYELVQLGTFDDESGRHSNLDTPLQLATGKSVTRREE